MLMQEMSQMDEWVLTVVAVAISVLQQLSAVSVMTQVVCLSTCVLVAPSN